jgi:patatin-like phospholipase
MAGEPKPAAAKPAAEDANVFWIFQDEIKAINQRRRQFKRPLLPLDPNFENVSKVIDATGLCLSGGGVRSAAVCLGVLQALNNHNALRNIDYLSTVSGGGYIGCALTVTMSKSNGNFVFGNRQDGGATTKPASEISDTDAVGHIRNYSNYLIPRGFRDVLTGAAIVVRGLVANLGLVLPVVLLFAALTVWSNPDRSSLLQPDLFGFSLSKYLPVNNFGITLALSLFGLLLFFAWALYRSFLPPGGLSEFRTRLPKWAGFYLVLLAATFFCELQPFVVVGMFDLADAKVGLADKLFLGLITTWIQKLAAVATPISAVVMFFRQQIGDILKSSTASSGLGTKLLAMGAKASVWVAGAALPLLIWVAFLYLCYWGIINDMAKPDGVMAACPRGEITTSVKIDSSDYSGEFQGKLSGKDQEPCPAVSDGKAQVIGQGTHTPRWLLTSAETASKWLMGRVIDRPMALLYLTTGALLFLISWLLAPNANSLHRLYRDRLSTAFLFDPMNRPGSKPAAATASIDQGRDFSALDTMRLSELSDALAPYHLINAALNIQGSDYANRRGRNADFFLFSKYWIGSQATGYAPIEDFEPNARDLDIATAMAISGAAASSNMGANSIRPLTPTLAILNVRLGYWLKNPAFWAPTGAIDQDGKKLAHWIPRHRSTLFLWHEITGRLYENAEEVYLTDGGHIENLGIYELLRRRCRVIVVVDAEADSAMYFPSFITLQRYARIDLGVRIDLPWERIHKTTRALMTPPPAIGCKPAEPLEPARGPHVAIGKINYGGGKIGYLIYVKSSLTGDENDYIRDYARRYSDFPHETTGDQFFSEEQFEVYRALGFHMMHGALCGDDEVQVQVDGLTEGEAIKFTDETNDTVRQVRAALLG